MDETTSSPKWCFKICLPFEMIILENEDSLPLSHMEEEIYDQNKKIGVFQFQVRYMTHPMMKT